MFVCALRCCCCLCSRAPAPFWDRRRTWLTVAAALCYLFWLVFMIFIFATQTRLTAQHTRLYNIPLHNSINQTNKQKQTLSLTKLLMLSVVCSDAWAGVRCGLPPAASHNPSASCSQQRDRDCSHAAYTKQKQTKTGDSQRTKHDNAKQ